MIAQSSSAPASSRRVSNNASFAEPPSSLSSAQELAVTVPMHCPSHRGPGWAPHACYQQQADASCQTSLVRRRRRRGGTWAGWFGHSGEEVEGQDHMLSAGATQPCANPAHKWANPSSSCSHPHISHPSPRPAPTQTHRQIYLGASGTDGHVWMPPAASLTRSTKEHPRQTLNTKGAAGTERGMGATHGQNTCGTRGVRPPPPRPRAGSHSEPWEAREPPSLPAAASSQPQEPGRSSSLLNKGPFGRDPSAPGTPPPSSP